METRDEFKKKMLKFLDCLMRIYTLAYFKSKYEKT